MMQAQRVVRHLRERFPGVPIFFAGDTNCRPSSAAPADERGSRIEDVVGDLGTIVAPPGPTNLRWNKEQNESEMTFADFGVYLSA
jgi:hypothetical protein